MITTGDIVKVPFAYMDSPETEKIRYGLIVSDEEFHKILGRRRYIAVYLSTSLPRYLIEGWEYLIKEGTEIFEQSGLQKTSIIKAHRIALIQEENILEVVGKVPLSLVNEIREKAIKRMFGL